MEDTSLRCPSRIAGKIIDGLLEVKCPGKHCRAGKGVLVFHYFDLLTGELVNTRTFREPSELFSTKKEAASCR